MSSAAAVIGALRVKSVLLDGVCHYTGQKNHGAIFFSRAQIEDTKKWGMLNLVNQLFKIYFKVSIIKHAYVVRQVGGGGCIM